MLRLKCTKFNFGWGSAPGPAGGAYSASPGPLGGLNGSTSTGSEGKGWRMGGERERGEERRGNGKEGQEGREAGRKTEGAPIAMMPLTKILNTPLTTPVCGQFVVTKLMLLGLTRAQNLTILSSAIPEKFKGV